MKRDDDIVARIVAHGIEQGLWSAEVGRLLDEQLRLEFGGEDDLYVAASSWRTREERDRRVLEALEGGATVRQVASQYCIGVATVHRIRASLRGPA